MARRVQRDGRGASGGKVAIAAIIALASVCLAGSPLYLSSVATAAVQSELSHTCLADVGLRIPMTGIQDDSEVRLAALSGTLPHTQPGTLSRLAPVWVSTGIADDLPSRAFLVYRDGQDANVSRQVSAPGDGDVLVPDWFDAPRGVSPGQVLTLANSNIPPRITWTQPARVADTYPLVPTRPEPAYWCGLRTLFRSPTADPADPPSPVLLTTSDDVRTAGVYNIAEWEVRPDLAGLSRHDAAVLADRFDAVATAARQQVSIDDGWRNRPLLDGEPLRTVVRHAEAATAVVAGTMAPVRLVGLLAALALLVSATTLLAREQQRELRLRLLKGQSPLSLGVLVARTAVPAVVAGAIAGSAAVFAAVRYFGPSPLFETAAIRSAVGAAVLGAIVAIVVVAVAAAGRARTFVDAPVRIRSWARLVPWELIPVGGVVFTFARLDRIGGIRQIGTKVANADFWAQCFPVLAILAPLAVLARPVMGLLRRWRLAGQRLPPAIMTGLRRSLAEPVVTGALLLATALAAGAITVSRLLTDSTSTLLTDKASTFLGGDLLIVTRDVDTLPQPVATTGTIVARSQGHSGGQAIDLLGVDRATLAQAVHWRDDAADQSLPQLLSAITPTGSKIPAIIVGGPLPANELTTSNRQPITVTPVATARWFPGLHNGAILVVVDREALTSSIPTSTEIWLRDPPPDAVATVSAAGLAARNPRDLSQVFDVTSFQTVRWAYDTLSMLGALVGIVVLLTQLLVLDARRQVRQAGHVLTRRMGLSLRGEAAGLLAELAPALVGGAVLGAAIGWVVSRLSVPRLDSLRQLEPPARLVAEPSAALPLLAGVSGCLVLLVAVGVVMVSRTRTMEVMRGTA